uniref:Uncharacterized protein n=1 Tax=Populus trichocarpa TaxID=3694 RepID=U5GPW3_POPTR
MKAGLFFNTSWAGYLGWQWRRVRTMQNEINELKKQVKPTPVTPEGTPVTAITVLGAAAEALVPAMQKGNETARNFHIALNAINVVLFLWQIPTGIDMVLKVFEFTKWP